MDDGILASVSSARGRRPMDQWAAQWWDQLWESVSA